jgi:hypothetical protein
MWRTAFGEKNVIVIPGQGFATAMMTSATAALRMRDERIV